MVDAKYISLIILCSLVVVILVRCMKSAIAFGKGDEFVAYEYRLCSFWSIEFGRVQMYLPFGSWIIMFVSELGCCVIMVEPVGIASRSGFIRVVV